MGGGPGTSARTRAVRWGREDSGAQCLRRARAPGGGNFRRPRTKGIAVEHAHREGVCGRGGVVGGPPERQPATRCLPGAGRDCVSVDRNMGAERAAARARTRRTPAVCARCGEARPQGRSGVGPHRGFERKLMKLTTSPMARACAGRVVARRGTCARIGGVVARLPAGGRRMMSDFGAGR